MLKKKIQVDADVLQEIALNGKESGFDADLDGRRFAELVEQTDHAGSGFPVRQLTISWPPER